MRAAEPSTSGFVERDGIRIGYEVFGGGAQTVVFAPIDPIVESRAWKAQVPWLARRATVVTIDPRGNGRSDRPLDPSAYADQEFAGDTVAVMDALGIDSAVLVGLCSSVWTSLLVAAAHPDRVRGLVAVAPWVPYLTPPHPWRVEYDYDAVPDTDQGWAKATRWHMQRDFRGYLEFFFGELAHEPHSSKVREDCVAWGLQIGGEGLIAADDGPTSVSDAAGAQAVLDRVHCPALVIHGDEDRCQPSSRAVVLADVLRAERLTLVGAGHLPMVRHPVAVNRAIGAFLQRLEDAAPPTPVDRADPAGEAGAVPVLADRAGARPARPRDRRGAASPGDRACRSTGWPSRR